MDIKCKQPLSVNFSAQPVDEKESDRALFAFFDQILDDQKIEIKNNNNENEYEPKNKQRRRAVSQASV